MTDSESLKQRLAVTKHELEEVRKKNFEAIALLGSIGNLPGCVPPVETTLREYKATVGHTRDQAEDLLEKAFEHIGHTGDAEVTQWHGQFGRAVFEMDQRIQGVFDAQMRILDSMTRGDSSDERLLSGAQTMRSYVINAWKNHYLEKGFDWIVPLRDKAKAFIEEAVQTCTRGLPDNEKFRNKVQEIFTSLLSILWRLKLAEPVATMFLPTKFDGDSCSIEGYKPKDKPIAIQMVCAPGLRTTDYILCPARVRVEAAPNE